ncbi:hypothetical protein AA15669_1044 [Saccharibacter floricola DSM 15669]|uniref:Uncharacterized protein n=1 Tax=Saccharibacter floricola DSM 15669 TaxID=1123227 RepID=A0ABQ0NYN0_9PROT|nr:hypothetical protein AA15669_1044 [Saccharibacter floricola DSM 15669]
MHAFFGVTNGHHPQRVAMIAATEREEFMAVRRPSIEVELHGDFASNFHRDGAGIGKENALKVSGEKGTKPGR